MKALDPALPTFAQYGGEHWRVAAGIPANSIFVFADRVQFVCGGAALMTLGFWLATLARLRQEGERLSVAPALLRSVALTGAMAGLCYQLFILGPRMNASLKAWLGAALDGDTVRAETLRAVFDADHPTASRTLGFTAACVLAGLIVHLWNPPMARIEKA